MGKKVALLVVCLMVGVNACATQNVVTVKRNRAGQVVKLETNADAAVYRCGKEMIAVRNIEAIDALCLAAGGIANNVRLGFGWHWLDVDRSEQRNIHRSGGFEDTKNVNERVRGRVNVNHNYDGAVEVNGTGGWENHLIWGP